MAIFAAVVWLIATMKFESDKHRALAHANSVYIRSIEAEYGQVLAAFRDPEVREKLMAVAELIQGDEAKVLVIPGNE